MLKIIGCPLLYLLRRVERLVPLEPWPVDFSHELSSWSHELAFSAMSWQSFFYGWNICLDHRDFLFILPST